jgi:hypothetical protein
MGQVQRIQLGSWRVSSGPFTRTSSGESDGRQIYELLLKATYSYEVEDIEPQEDGKPLYVVLMVARRRFNSFSQTLSSFVKIYSYLYLDHPSPGQGCLSRKPRAHKCLPRVPHKCNRFGSIPRYKLFLPCGSCRFSKGHPHSRPSKHRSILAHCPSRVLTGPRTLEQRTTNSNSKTTTTRNTWCRQQKL